MTVIFIIALILYAYLGMIFYGSYAPPFLAVALICLFVVMKKIWTELQAVHELLKKENNEDEDEEEEEEDLGSEITDESEETKEPDETK